MKTSLSDVIVIVSAASLLPIVPALREPYEDAVDGVNTNTRSTGVSPTPDKILSVATEVNVANVAARIVYVVIAFADAVVSFVVTIVNTIAVLVTAGFTAKAPAVALVEGVPEIITLALVRVASPTAPMTVRVASLPVPGAPSAPPSEVPFTVIVSPAL